MVNNNSFYFSVYNSIEKEQEDDGARSKIELQLNPISDFQKSKWFKSDI